LSYLILTLTLTLTLTSPHAWSKHDAVLRVGVGASDLERKDAFAVLKDGRVCTADGTIGKCGEEDGPAAKSRLTRTLSPEPEHKHEHKPHP
jgi:hypothetical protein